MNLQTQMIYGGVLYKSRQQLGWSIDELREQIGEMLARIPLGHNFKPKVPSKSVISQYERNISVPKADIAMMLAMTLRNRACISEHPRAAEYVGRWAEAAASTVGNYGNIEVEWERVLSGCVEYVFHSRGKDIHDTLTVRIYDLWSNVVAHRTFKDIYQDHWVVSKGEWVYHAIEVVARNQGRFITEYAKFLFMRGIRHRLSHQNESALLDFSSAETMYESSNVRSYERDYWLIDMQMHKAIASIEAGRDMEAHEAHTRFFQLCTNKRRRDAVLAYYLYGLSFYYTTRKEHQMARKAGRIGLRIISRLRSQGQYHSEEGWLNLAFSELYNGSEILDFEAVQDGLRAIVETGLESSQSRTFYWRAVAVIQSVTNSNFEDLNDSIKLSEHYDSYRTFARREELFAKWHLLHGNPQKAEQFLEELNESHPVDVVRMRLAILQKHIYYWHKTYFPESMLILNRTRLKQLLSNYTPDKHRNITIK